jgi:hypothetical protein
MLIGETAGDLGEVGWYEDTEDDFVDALEGRESTGFRAGGGSSKDIWPNWGPSFPLMSEEEPGVGGRLGRGILEWIVCHRSCVGRNGSREAESKLLSNERRNDSTWT